MGHGEDVYMKCQTPRVGSKAGVSRVIHLDFWSRLDDFGPDMTTYFS